MKINMRLALILGAFTLGLLALTLNQFNLNKSLERCKPIIPVKEYIYITPDPTPTVPVISPTKKPLAK